MRISEAVKLLEGLKEKHGDLQLVQHCSSEELYMPIRGASTVRHKITNQLVLALDDNHEEYFRDLPSEKTR